MTVESVYKIVIAILSKRLKNLAPVFQPLKSKAKTSRTFYARSLPRFKQVKSNCNC